MDKRDIVKQQSDFILYTSNEGDVNVEVFLKDETVWLTQKAIGKLFGKSKATISEHLKKIYAEGELQIDSTVRNFRTVQTEGLRQVVRDLEFYNLDAIISVGYRVNSYQATQFRIWATKTLKKYIIKGFVLDDERIKQGNQVFGRDYFEELLERIREIRASERRFYQKITDIYALAVDYDKNAPVTKDFFATVQNKLHWAITGKTAAEIIYDSADAKKMYMGLTNWKRAPDGKIIKSDISIAKNYLNEAHIKELNQIISAYLDLAENRAQRQILMKMEDWIQFLHNFLELSSYPILQDKGKVSALKAKLKAEQEYEEYRVIQDINYISDFDNEIKHIKGKI
ncbi:MAG: Virulence protein RhuM family protein [Candidatus Argoarchaeum ethanivorans]|uniref:Virulence protein RhuM family protein n=1 Tax=Candidatus Argoarchaeum ethanivorans TaxID=2608793 RepID=A0A811T872_9EURY|nr:MAG: Virulence protein RhuM family protein [Candidatus Argoarchaeum ethanivorans]CAD6492521.1 MAG: Virulence protein RhuM family protein [Candidatus Argoarchaeum ethanivorans]